MIVFDLNCAEGHRFEGWFGSSSDYEEQAMRGLVTCPECGCGEVSKAVMAPAVGAKGNRSAEPAPDRAAEQGSGQGGQQGDQQGDQQGARSPQASAPAHAQGQQLGQPVSNEPIPPEVQKALKQLAKAQEKALKNSTWVGKDFAKASREMHYGERDQAAIHGQATIEEAQSLAEEGVPVAALPFPVAPPDKLN